MFKFGHLDLDKKFTLHSLKLLNKIGWLTVPNKMSKQEENKIGKFKKLLTRQNILKTIAVVIFLLMFFQIQMIYGTFSLFNKKDTSLITEIGQIKDYYSKFGQDLNEVREFLRLPTSNYGSFEEPETGEDNDKNKDSLQLALFSYVDYLASSKNIENKVATGKTLLSGLIDSKTFAEFLKPQALKISGLLEDDNGYSAEITTGSGERLIFFYLSKEDGTLFQKTLKEKKEVKEKTPETFVSGVQTFLTDKKDSLVKEVRALSDAKAKISAAINAKETQETLAALKIKLQDQYTDKNLKLTYTISNQNDELIGEIVLDTEKLEISLVDKNNEAYSLKVTDISTSLAPFLKKLDTKNLVQKKVDKSIKEVADTLNDDGFKLLLSENGLKMGEKAREDNQRIYYDIYYKDDTPISSIVVEKATGVVNIVQPDGTNSQNLMFFDPEFKKKTLEIPDKIPEYDDEFVESENSFNILVSGKHGSLVDTMIFAHIDENKREVRMISIPRDLHYNGRKINSYAFYYGMPELKRVLSEITGYELDKYILIDMYAFIDVIDLIGGIDIHLNNAVIDPTYRTVDNGKVGTLHYEPGDYHLSGVQALRLARTRHTSSDFARAERQQMILEAIQDKARNFGFGDADTIYEIAKSVLSKTETDISIDEAIAYYFRYQNYDIVSNDVMSSGNVLYVPPYITTENCQELVAAAAAAGQPKPGCENENHAYTLLPRNNNWNIIKWFFREKFEAQE